MQGAHVHVHSSLPLVCILIQIKQIYNLLDVFLTLHHSIDLSNYQLSAHSLNIQHYKLHYTPQHDSSSTLLIIRRTDCITILYGCLQRVTIPEAVVIQLVLLMMSSVLLETC